MHMYMHVFVDWHLYMYIYIYMYMYNAHGHCKYTSHYLTPDHAAVELPMAYCFTTCLLASQARTIAHHLNTTLLQYFKHSWCGVGLHHHMKIITGSK